MPNNKLITPRKLSGFMELPPHKQIVFDNMIDTIKKVYKNNCFVPLDTPVLEYSEILLAKSSGEIDKELYHFTKGDSDVCMRYDLTVPLARFVAMNADTMTFPFKRYQVGKVFRGERLLNEIASVNNVHPKMPARWKAEASNSSPGIRLSQLPIICFYR